MTNRFLEKGPLSETQDPVNLIEIISEDNDKQQGLFLEEYFEELVRCRHKIKSISFIDTRYLQRHYDKKYSSNWGNEEPQISLFKILDKAKIAYKVYSWEEIYKVNLEVENNKIESDKISCLREGYDYKRAEKEFDELVQSNAYYLENKLINLAKQYQSKKDNFSAQNVAKEEGIITLMLKGVISYPNKSLNPVNQCLIDKGINPDLKFHGRRAEISNKKVEKFSVEITADLPKSSTFSLVTTCTVAVNQIVEKQRGKQLSDEELFKIQFLLGEFFSNSTDKKNIAKFNNYSIFFPSVNSSTKNSDKNYIESSDDVELGETKNKWCNIL